MKKIFINKSEELKQLFEEKEGQEFLVYYRGETKFLTNHIRSLYTEIRDIFENQIYGVEIDSCYPFIIDGGGHIGVSVLYYKTKFPNSEILVFEPNPISLKYLKKNIKINNLKNVKVVEKALYDKETVLYFESLITDGSSIKDTGNIKVKSDILSKYINKKVDILKLNIEGAEFAVMNEMKAKLSMIDNIIFEYHAFPQFDQTLHKILKILENKKFRYIINHFDEEINKPAIPPFNINKRTKYFQLVYAKNIKSIKKKTKYPIVEKYNKASLLEKKFEFEKAKKEFCSLLQTIDESSNNSLKTGIYFHLGCIERKLGNEKQAIEYFKKCLKLNPQHKKASLYMRTPELKGLKPVSEFYGAERGTPIDRYYIEKFIKENQKLIKGNILEILDKRYTILFGEKDKIKKSDILDIDINNKRATIYADLRKPEELPQNEYDLIILTQTIHVIDDMFSVLKSVYRMLKKGGVVLATLPSLSRIDVAATESGDFWRFTKASAKYLFSKFFEPENIKVKNYGNVFVSSAFLYGYAHEEIPLKLLEYSDDNFPMLISVKAEK